MRRGTPHEPLGHPACRYRSPMDISLVGKRALVCGSTQGIGRAAATELASLGARVTMVARDEDRLRLAAAELPRPHGAGQAHDYVVADFSKPEQLKQNV